jgi:hypothetical protein
MKEFSFRAAAAAVLETKSYGQRRDLKQDEVEEEEYHIIPATSG